jgi:hypothetical protein
MTQFWDNGTIVFDNLRYVESTPCPRLPALNFYNKKTDIPIKNSVFLS